MKSVLSITTSFALAALMAPAVAHAEDKPISVTVEAVTAYSFPDQAFIIRHPAVNVNVSVKETDNLSGFVWAQVGNRDETEIDLGQTAQFDIGKVNVHGNAAVYLYPNGQKTIFTEGVGISVPVEGFTLEGAVQHYDGGLNTTKFVLSASHPVTVGETTATVTIGHGWNTEDLKGVNPWYASVSAPVGDSGLTFKVAGFVGAGSGGFASLSYGF